MPATLTAAQVHAGLTAPQIEALDTHWPNSDEGQGPVMEEITAALARVDAAAAGWLPSAALLTHWARALAVWELTKTLGIATEDQKEARDRALLELEALRDGKYPGVAKDPAGATATAGRVSYGGRDNIL
jgi:hypothetical protein